MGQNRQSNGKIPAFNRWPSRTDGMRAKIKMDIRIGSTGSIDEREDSDPRLTYDELEKRGVKMQKLVMI
jgi:hypothetical protein